MPTPSGLTWTRSWYLNHGSPQPNFPLNLIQGYEFPTIVYRQENTYKILRWHTSPHILTSSLLSRLWQSLSKIVEAFVYEFFSLLCTHRCWTRVDHTFCASSLISTPLSQTSRAPSSLAQIGALAQCMPGTHTNDSAPPDLRGLWRRVHCITLP